MWAQDEEDVRVDVDAAGLNDLVRSLWAKRRDRIATVNATRPDLTSTRLCVVAVSLIHQAADLAKQGSVIDYASAVVRADVAPERLLGLPAGPARTPARLGLLKAA